MAAPSLDTYTVDHLFLLVGENPMPNLVAGKLLTTPDSKIYLIHSTATEPQATRLEALLGKQQVKRISLGRNETDPFHLETTLKSYLQKISPQDSIGLHYTGGRKVMAVHAYRTLRWWELRWWEYEKQQSVIFSYLNASSLTLQIDDYKNCRSISIPIAKAVNPTLTDILQLHNLKWKPDTQPITQPQHPEIAATIASFFKSEPNDGQHREWCEWLHVFRSLAKYSEQKFRWEAELKNLQIPLTKAPLDFQKIARQSLSASVDSLHLDISRQQGHFSSCDDLCQWLNGLWLEDYVLDQVQQLSDRYSLRKACRSLHIDDPKKPRKTDQFEFDIVFLHGYQLFGISCTTASKHSICKQKLFEAHLRAQQMGGDEVRTALVCTHESPEQLRAELNLDRDSTAPDPKIQVFGHRDLPKLQDKLSAWIKANTEFKK